MNFEQNFSPLDPNSEEYQSVDNFGQELDPLAPKKPKTIPGTNVPIGSIGIPVTKVDKPFTQIENSIKSVKTANTEYQNLLAKKGGASSVYGEAPGDEIERNKQFTSALKSQSDELLKKYSNDINKPIDQVISSGKWEEYITESGGFNYDKARGYFDYVVKQNGGGTYVRDLMISKFQNAVVAKKNEKDVKPFLKEEIAKTGLNLDKDGNVDFASIIGTENLKAGQEAKLKSIAPAQFNKLQLIESDSEKQVNQLLNASKDVFKQEELKFNTLKQQVQAQLTAGQITQEEAQNTINDALSGINQMSESLNNDFQKAVRDIRVKTSSKYARISKEIGAIGSGMSLDDIISGLPKDKQKEVRDRVEAAKAKVNIAYENAYSKLSSTKNEGKKAQESMIGLGGLAGKSFLSGWNNGLASLGGYLNMNGIDNSFADWLRAHSTTGEELAPAQYEWSGKEWYKRGISSAMQSTGMSLPTMAPTLAITAAGTAAGVPAVGLAVINGVLGYLGERNQNSFEVYDKEIKKGSNPNDALIKAETFERMSVSELPFHLLGGLADVKLFQLGASATKSAGKGVKSIVTEYGKSFGGELLEEYPTELLQNYNQAKLDGYKGSLFEYGASNPELFLDTLVSTLGQGSVFAGAGKVFGAFTSAAPESRIQFYTDMIQKNGIEYAKTVAKKYYDSGILDGATATSVSAEIDDASKIYSDLLESGLDDNAAKLYVAMHYQSKSLSSKADNKKESVMGSLAKLQLANTQSQMKELANGTLPYVVMEIPGGENSSRVISLQDFNTLTPAQKTNVIQASNSISVINDEDANTSLQEQKKQLGNTPNAPVGLFTNNIKTTQDATQESTREEQISTEQGGISQYQGTQPIQEQATNETKDSNRPISGTKKVITLQNINEIDQIEGNDTQKKVLGDVKNVTSSIAGFVQQDTGSELKVNIHDQTSFTQAVLEAGGTQQDAKSKGFYMSSDGNIHLNMDNVSEDTMLHEGFHPVLDYIEKNSPDTMNSLFEQLKSIPQAQDFVQKAEAAYNENGSITVKKEAITDFIANVANGNVKVDATNLETLKNYIIGLLNKLGLNLKQDRILNLETAEDLKNLATFITEKFTSGSEITQSELGKFVETKPTAENPIAKSGQLQFSKTIYGESGIEKSPALDSDEFVQAVQDGRISVSNPYQSLMGKFFGITFPDDLFTGELKVNGETVGFGFGGVFYVAKFGAKGLAWASVGKQSASNFTIQANASLKKNNGEGIIVLSKGDDIKHATSLQAKVAFINTLLKYAENNNQGESLVKSIRKIYNIGNAKSPSKIIEYFNNYLASGRMESGQTMFDAKGSFDNLMTSIIKEAQPVITKMFQDMGLEGDTYFDKTQLRKDNKIATTKGLKSLYADMLQEDFLKGAPKGGIYAAIKFSSELEYVVDKSHPSYPYVIKTKDGSPVKLEVFSKTFNAYGKDVAVKGVERNTQNAFGVVTTTKPNFQINEEMEGNKSEHILSNKLDAYEAISKGKSAPQFQKDIVPTGGVPSVPGETGVGEANQPSGLPEKKKYSWEKGTSGKPDPGETMIKTSTGRYVAIETMAGQMMDRDKVINEIKKAEPSFFSKHIRDIRTKWRDNQYNVLKSLSEIGKSGMLVKHYLLTRNSASATATAAVESAIKEIYGKISKKKTFNINGAKVTEYVLFNQMINYQRVISIQEQMNDAYKTMISSEPGSQEYNKAKKKLLDNNMIDVNGDYVGESLDTEFAMGNVTATQSKALLYEIRESIGEESFDKLMNASEKYSNHFNKMMKERYEAGLISEDTYKYLSKFYYAPGRYVSDVLIDPILSIAKTTPTYQSTSILKMRSLAGGTERLNLNDYEGLLRAVTYASEYSIAENRATNRFYDLISENKTQFNSSGIRLGTKLVPIEAEGPVKFDIIDEKVIAIQEGKAKSALELPSGQKQLPYKGIQKPSDMPVGKYIQPIDIVLDEDGNKFRVVYETPKVGEDIIKTYYNGQQYDIIVPAWFADAWYNRNMATGDTSSLIAKITGANVLRLVATGINPVFGIAQIVPDTISAYASTLEERKLPLLIDYPRFFIKTLAASRDIMKKTDDFKEATKYGATTNFYNGGSVSFERGLMGLEDKSLEKVVEEWNVPVLKQYVMGSKRITETTEQMTKVAIYKEIRDRKIKEFKQENNREPNSQELEDIKIESGSMARGTADFHRKGSSASNVNKVIPYLNAAIQINRAVLRSIKKNPMKAVYYSMEYMGHAAVFSLMAMGAGDDDELKEKKRRAYLGLSEFERDNNFLMYFNESEGKFVAQKLPSFLVPFNAFSRRLTERIYLEKKEITPKDIREIASSVADMFPLLQILNVEKTLSRNPAYSFAAKLFFNRDPYRQEAVAKYDESTKNYLEGAMIGKEQSSAFSRKIGELTKNGVPLFPEGISPKRLDAALGSIPFQSNPISAFPLFAADATSITMEEFEEKYGKNAASIILSASGISKRYFKGGSRINQNLAGLSLENIKDRGEMKNKIAEMILPKFEEFTKNMTREDAFVKATEDFISNEFDKLTVEQKIIAQGYITGDLRGRIFNVTKDKQVSQILNMEDPNAKIDAILYTMKNVRTTDSSRDAFINELVQNGITANESFGRMLAVRGEQELPNPETGVMEKNNRYEKEVGELLKKLTIIFEKSQ
jgi:hypothetical protein